jgi:hypothetical protein
MGAGSSRTILGLWTLRRQFFLSTRFVIILNPVSLVKCVLPSWVDRVRSTQVVELASDEFHKLPVGFGRQYRETVICNHSTASLK